MMIATLGGLSQMPYLDTSWVAQGPAGDETFTHNSSILVNGKLVMTGNIVDSGGDTDIFTIMFNNNGDTVWTATYDGSAGADDYGIELAATTTGDIIVVGTAQTTTGGYDYAVIKYKGTTGNQMWSYTWDGAGGGIDIPAMVKLDGSNRVYVVGGSQSSTGFSDYGVIKVTPTGTLAWANYYDYNDLHDAAVDLSVAGTEITVTGGSAAATGDWDIATVKFSTATGVRTDSSRSDIDSTTMVEAFAMVDDADNNIYITGYAEVSGDKQIQTIKLDSNLDVVWVEDYDTDYDDVGKDIALDGSGNVYVTGYSEQGDGKHKATTIKYSSSGSELWTHQFGNIRDEQGAKAQKIAISDSGQVYITGSTLNTDTLSSYFFNQYDLNGNLLLSAEYDSYGVGDTAYDIHIDADTIYVTGLANSSSSPTLTAVKYTLQQDVELSYYYAGGNRSNWTQQPGVYAFGTTDSTEMTGLIDTTVVQSTEFYQNGFHYVYFNPNANASQVDSVINEIEGESNFSKEYLVGVLTSNNTKSVEHELYAGLDDFIEVVFDDPYFPIDSISAFADDHDLTLYYSPPNNITGGVYIFQVDRDSDPAHSMNEAAHIWEADSAKLKIINPSLRMLRAQDPNDTLYSDMWFAENGGSGSGICNDGGSYVSDADIDLDRAWNLDNEFGYGVSWSGLGVKVGVIDVHGYQYSHPDMTGAYETGYLLPSLNPFFGDLVYATNAGHGHCVSSIIASNLNDTTGVAGVAYNSTIVPCLGDGPTLSTAEMIAGIEKLSDTTLDVSIINISHGAKAILIDDDEASALKIAIDKAYQQGRISPDGDTLGMIIIASNGNIIPPDSDLPKIYLPAAWDEVLSVGATTPQDKRKNKTDGYENLLVWSSNYGHDIDVSAPGTCIKTGDIDLTGNGGYSEGEFTNFEGTSASAPIACGVAALMLEKNAELTNEQVYNYLRWGCEKVGGYSYLGGSAYWSYSEYLGYGRLNAFKSLAWVTPLETEEIEVPLGMDFFFNNPANNQLFLSVPNVDHYTVTITSITGKICYHTDASGMYNELDLSALSNGLYVISVYDMKSDVMSSKKLLIQ